MLTVSRSGGVNYYPGECCIGNVTGQCDVGRFIGANGSRAWRCGADGYGINVKVNGNGFPETINTLVVAAIVVGVKIRGEYFIHPAIFAGSEVVGAIGTCKKARRCTRRNIGCIAWHRNRRDTV